MFAKLAPLAKREFKTVLISTLVTIIGFLILAFWRLFQNSTFLFTQILIVTAILGVIVYFISSILENRFSALLRGRELTSIVLAFTLISFVTLNVDRSRSFYLVKWVSESSDTGTTLQEISKSKNFSREDIKDFRQRINEQKESGTLKLENGRIKVTFLGSIVVLASRFVAKFASLQGYLKG
jgi:hypothetical protein